VAIRVSFGTNKKVATNSTSTVVFIKL
jgi:hypothetical protein